VKEKEELGNALRGGPA
jgi:hypothetical protein